MMICPGYNLYVNKNQMKMYCYEDVPPYLWNICDYCVKIGCADKFGDKIKEFDACGKPGETVCDHMEFSCNCFNCHEVMNKQFCADCLVDARNAIGHNNCVACGTITGGSKYCYPCAYVLKVCICGEPHILASIEQSELDEISRYFELTYVRHRNMTIDLEVRKKTYYISEKVAMKYPEELIHPHREDELFSDPRFAEIHKIVLAQCDENADADSYKEEINCAVCGTHDCEYLAGENPIPMPKTSYGLRVSLPDPVSIAKTVAKMSSLNRMYTRIFRTFSAGELLEAGDIIMDALENDEFVMMFPTEVFIKNYDNTIFRKYMQRLVDLNKPTNYYLVIDRILHNPASSVLAHKHKQKFLPEITPEFAIKAVLCGSNNRFNSTIANVCAMMRIYDVSVVVKAAIETAIETGSESMLSTITGSCVVSWSVDMLHKAIEFKRSVMYTIIMDELKIRGVRNFDRMDLFNRAISRVDGDKDGNDHLQLIANDNIFHAARSYMSGGGSPQDRANFKYMADKYKETFGECYEMITELMFERLISEGIAEDMLSIGYIPTEDLISRLCRMFTTDWNKQRVNWWVVSVLRAFRKYYVIDSQNEHVPYVYKNWSDEFNVRLLEFERTHDYKRAPTQSSLTGGEWPILAHIYTTWVNVFYDEEYFLIIDKLKSFTSYPTPNRDETGKNRCACGKYDCGAAEIPI